MFSVPKGSKLDYSHPHSRNIIADYVYPMGDHGETLGDFGRNKMDGTLNGGDWISTPTGGGVHFNGSSDYIDIGPLPQLTGLSQMTLMLVYKNDNQPSIEHLATQWSGGGWSIFQINNTGQRLGGVLGVVGAGISTWPTIGEWHTVFLVFDGTLAGNVNRFKMYLDGDPTPLTLIFAGGTVPATMPDLTASNASIGRFTTTRHFDGIIALTTFWGRALSGNQTSRIAGNLLGRYGLRTSPAIFAEVGAIPPAVSLDLLNPQILNLKQSGNIKNLKSRNQAENLKTKGKIKWVQ